MLKSKFKKLSVTAMSLVMLAGCVGGGYQWVLQPKPVKSGDAETANFGEVNENPATRKPTQHVLLDTADGDLYKLLVKKGSPDDKGGDIAFDLWSPHAAGGGGSVFGFRINQAMKVTVTSKDFVPRDDAQARRVAERFAVNRIGTLGILRRAKKTGLISLIRPYIVQLQESGIYIRQTLVDAVSVMLAN